MKKILIALFSVLVLISCKNNTESTSTEETQETTTDTLEYKGPQVSVRMPTYRGEFYLSEEAAVLKGKDFIYGVERDSMALALAERVAPVKVDEFDMVPVVVQGILSKKEEGAEGWDEVLTIKTIITVSNKASSPDIKIEEKQ